jgi:hypothetical protein
MSATPRKSSASRQRTAQRLSDFSPLSKLTDLITDKTLTAAYSFKESELEGMRMQILEEMKDKTFDHYLKQMYKFRDESDEVLRSDSKILDDDYWTKPGSLCEKPYWTQQSPELKSTFKLDKSRSGTVTISTQLLSEKYVEQLIGTADWMTIQQKILFKTMILTYFKSNLRLLPIHLNMDFTFLKAKSKTSALSPLEKVKSLFKSLLSGAGPFILKILQQINTANDSKIDGKISVSDITKDIFSMVPPLTKQETEFVLGSFDIDQSYVTEPNYSPKVLGSASIAETHKTFSEQYDQKAVLKFIKPIYAYYFLCELNFLLSDAWKEIRKQSKGDEKHIKQCRKLLLFFVNEFIKEFDYFGEYVNTTVGFKIYDRPEDHVSSIVALGCSVNPFPVLILSYVDGKSVDSLVDEASKSELITLYKYVDNLVKIWFKNTLWGNGFFHADLHPGNVIVDKSNTVNVIDFGSCGILSKSEKCAMITAMVISGQFVNMEKSKHNTDKGRKAFETNLKVSEKFVKAIWNVCHVKDYSSSHLKDVSRKIVDLRFGDPEGGLNFSTLFLDIIKYSDDIGLCTNSPVLLFGRACAYIGSLMKRIEGKCNDINVCPAWGVDGIIQSNLIRHPGQLARFFTKGSVC